MNQPHRVVVARVLGTGLVAVLLAAFLAGCASRASIGHVTSNPGRFADRRITVDGTVTSAWRIPLVPMSLYRVDDGTGEILVVSDLRRSPTRGARVRVTGTVSDVAVLGGRSVGLHLRARDLDYRR